MKHILKKKNDNPVYIFGTVFDIVKIIKKDDSKV